MARSLTPGAPSDTAFLLGGGEMGERMRAHDWSRTVLGPAALWPRSLKTAVRIMLTSRQPMFVWWGEELINLYNDPYKAIIGGKHPDALGRPAARVWSEIWDQIASRAESALRRNEGTYDEALLLIMERNGYPEETYYTFSYSPVPDDDGGTGGIICANSDDTQRIIGERQLTLFRELSTGAADARTVADACARCATALATDPHDVPFAMIYLVEPDGRSVVLAGTAGIAHDHPAVPATLALDDPSPWPIAEAIRTRHPCVTPEGGLSGLTLPRGAWERAPDRAVAVPIARSGETGRSGVLVAGLNPFRLFDDSYRGFMELVSSHIAATIGNAHAYAEERRRAETLAELDRAKTAFFSNVSHEFRTPLTLMLGPIDELRATAADADRERIELLQRNALRLQKLVNTLLEFSRIEAGRIHASFAPTDLAALTTDLASTFRSACESAGLSLVVDCARLPEPIYVDHDMWEKIVLNLLSNAFKFTFAGEIRVALEATQGGVELLVRDTGGGIPAEQLPHVFERFRRVEGAAARTHEGTGIGLALVQELARLHGGSVGVTSEVGRGTTFRIAIPAGHAHLPRDQIAAPGGGSVVASSAQAFVGEALRWLPDALTTAASDGASWPVPPSVPLLREVPAYGRRPRIVLADDNADMRAYVQRLLSERFAVEAVVDGEAALAAIAREVPDLVLSDVMMPRLDGFGLLRALRADERTRTIPVVLLSARAGEEAEVEGLERGADDYLVKPFSAGELLARVTARLELARVRREVDDALRESEARFRHMADNAPVMVWMSEADGRCSFLSRSWYEFTGHEGDSGLGSGWLAAVHPEDRPAMQSSYLDANEQRRPFRQEYRLRHRDGQVRWVLDAAAPRFAPDGSFLGFIGSVIDISDRKRAEDALLEADRRKDEFLATLAHELRNPLAPIRNALHVLRMAPQHGATAERLHGMMERQVSHMVRLVDDLLEVSRITRGKIELRREIVDLAGVVRSAVESSKPLIDAGRHDLQVALPDAPLLLDADPVRLAQVIGNLLNNAAKYTARGGRIRLAARRSDDELVISVRDDGVGIPRDMLPKVFDLFTQVERTLSSAQGGLGIGLTLVRRIVELHGGRVEARSEGADAGSEFVVVLPLAKPRADGNGALQEDDPAFPLMPRRRVLVVDDNQDAAETLGMLLRVLGLDVHVANDGPAALAALRHQRPSVVLLDIGMPGMDGYEVAARIRAQSDLGDVVLIALTGWGQSDDRQRSRDAGFDHHLVKPVDLSTLQGLLQSL